MKTTQYVTYGDVNNNQVPIKCKIVDSFLEPNPRAFGQR